MIDENTLNDNWEEEATANFYQALEECDWEMARAILDDMDGYRFKTYELRRKMNIAMKDELMSGEEVVKDTWGEEMDRAMARDEALQDYGSEAPRY